MICTNPTCRRKTPALYPGLVCCNCFDFVAYAGMSIKETAIGRVYTDEERRKKKVWARNHRKKNMAKGLTSKGEIRA